MSFFNNQSCVDYFTLHAASGGITAGLSQLMAYTGSSGGNQSQDVDYGLQAIWREIEK